MNGAHLHLMLNHFPLVGLFFSALILGFGFFRRNESYLRIGLYAILLCGVLAAPTFLSGESAEEVIESLPAFSEPHVEAHEEAAELVIWLIGATAFAAFGSLVSFWKKPNLARQLTVATFILNLFAVIGIAWVNNLGGKISHPEIRDSAVEIR